MPAPGIRGELKVRRCLFFIGGVFDDTISVAIWSRGFVWRGLFAGASGVSQLTVSDYAGRSPAMRL
jgi:hypothetical protein